MSLVSLPLTLWHLYADNLVFYKTGSWVHSIASTFRFLAFATIIPFILLTLLDVASYIIARTLGVIDETKASTSGEHVARLRAHPNNPNGDTHPPAIIVHDPADADMTALAAATPLPDDGEHGNLKLSGVDTFSPAPSQPGSPTLQRHELGQLQHAQWEVTSSASARANLSMSSLYGRDRGRGARGGERDGAEEEGHFDSEKLRRAGGDVGGNGGDGTGEEGLVGGPGEEHEHERGAGSPREPSGRASAGSSSGDESYAILDRDSGSGTDDAGLVLRRRTRQGATGADAE